MANVTKAEYEAYMAAKPEKQAGESNTEYNQRITQWYKDQPHNPLTSAQEAAGATLQWVRTGAGGEGEYKVVYPIGVQFDKTTGAPIIDPNTNKAKNVFTSSTPAATSGNKTVVSSTKDKEGNTVVKYSDGSTATLDSTGAVVSGNTGSANLVTGSTVVTPKTDAQIAADATAAANKAARQSAYDLLYSQFKGYGLESLVEPLKALIQKDISPSQFTIELRNTPQYKTRFAANEQRIKNGFKALDEATYLGLEDSYQKLMQNYGLPVNYYQKGELGVQPGFEKLIAGNVDPIELEQRLSLAADQIEKGPKEYMDAIKQFYPEISRSDLMAYVLDPANALKSIQSKVKTAQIGGEYLRSNLATSEARAAELARQGVTADMARSNIPTIIEAATRGGQLSDIYARHGLGQYDQATAEEELYNLGKAAEAKKKREQLGALEQASWSGKTGVGALESGRAGLY